MKRSVVGCLLLLMQVFTAHADHITGGEMNYTFTGITNGMYNYQVTARLFMDCFSNRKLPDPAYFGIFNKGTGQHIKDLYISMAHQDKLTLSNPGPCITDPPSVCYDIGFYDFNVSLPAVAEGYIIVIQVVYRVQGISNLTPGYGNIGATYTGEIPGNGAVTSGPQNSSARFTGDDMVVICANNSFSYSFAAEDKDRDQLRYSFTNAYIGGSGGGGVNFPPVAPPYSSVPYGSKYEAGAPLGSNVKINPATGIMYKVLVYNEAGCVDSAYIKVKVFQTMPVVFVPNAFTPNGDGKNDWLRPIAVGMARIDNFQIYNRWGQLVFSTATNEHGWDGTVAGKLQPSGTYVWVVKAVDYTGAPYMQRGTLVLIR